MSLDIWVLALLALAGALAGFIDAIAGGGGLIALPVLLSVGVPPISALATNKMQSVVGTIVAAFTYWRRGFVSLRALLPAIAATFAGSLLGVLSIKSIDTGFLTTAMPVALVAIAGYFLFAPRLSDNDRAARLNFAAFVPFFGFSIGFYDGLFGPGTGAFFTMAFVALFGLGMTRASAHTKVLNVTSNLAALALFIPAGDVLWPAAGAMIVGQTIGARVGALTGIRFGARLIRPLVIIVSVVLAVRLLLVR